MTIKELKESLSKLPDDGKVYYQRIEDFYFNECGWDKGVVKQKDEDHIDEYVEAFTVINFDNNNLYITSHY